MGEATLLGGAIAGVIKAMLSPDAVLRDFPRYEECKAVIPDRPYPLSLYLELVGFLHKKLSRQVIFKIGRSVAREVIRVALSEAELKTPAQAIAAIQKAHEFFCKPVLGEFRVTEEVPHRLRVRYTAPYDCVLQEGLFYEFAITYGGGIVNVEHLECRRSGANACVYEIKYR
jgi:predicted hydrocarbon binding protein